jgi:hypothetical protein
MVKPAFIRACLSGVRVIMTIMHVVVVELRCQVVMGRILAVECLLSSVRGACVHVLSCLALNVTAS